jgi:hypothetical protein
MIGSFRRSLELKRPPTARGFCNSLYQNLPNNTGQFHNGSQFTFSYAEVTKVPNQLPGQGNPNPRSFFINHTLVSVYGVLYDPSYGTSYTGNDPVGAWISASVAGYTYLTGVPNSYPPGRNRWVIRTAASVDPAKAWNKENWWSISDAELGL